MIDEEYHKRLESDCVDLEESIDKLQTTLEYMRKQLMDLYVSRNDGLSQGGKVTPMKNEIIVMVYGGVSSGKSFVSKVLADGLRDNMIDTEVRYYDGESDISHVKARAEHLRARKLKVSIIEQRSTPRF